ncbi:MAG: arginase family protein, partial [Myxococcales bacterium]|nr:arginase family protein [Myxococcales bacterium]
MSHRPIRWSTAPTWPELNPGRVAAQFHRESTEGCQIGLLGLADDLGVRLNGGRPGAAEGPTHIRAGLSRYGAAQAPISWPLVFDAGDIRAGESLEDTHRHISDAVFDLREKGLFPVGIGGGHDLTFAFVRGVQE